MLATVTRLAVALQALFTTQADKLAQVCGLVKRQRRLSGSDWVQALVFGWGKEPTASVERITEMMLPLNHQITPQGLDNWFCQEGVACLQQLLEQGMGTLFQSEPAALPLLERFEEVSIEDCTSLRLPPELAKLFPGCGGNDTAGSGTASMKAFVRMDLKKGGLTALTISPARKSDAVAGQEAAALPKGSLRLKDLGFFDTQLMAKDRDRGVHFISRLPAGTWMREAGNEADFEEISVWLKRQPEGPIDRAVEIGKGQPFACRLLAVRCPEEVRQKRLRKLEQKASKDGRRPVSERQRELCGWLLFITDLSSDQLSMEEAWVLYRARWQIELLFKLWKSQGKLDASAGKRGDRVLCEIFAKLLALMMQHWTMLMAGPWLDGKSMLAKLRQVRRRLEDLWEALQTLSKLETVLQQIEETLKRVGLRPRRTKRPLTIDLLKNPSLADLSLS